MYASIPQLQGLNGIPRSYAAAKKHLEARGYNQRAKTKGKGVEYLVAVPDLTAQPTPTKNYYSVDTLFAKLQGKPGIPQTVSGLRRKIVKENWASRKREGKGGGYEYLAPCDLFEIGKLELVPDLEVPQHVPTTDRKAYRLRIIESCSQWCDENGIKIGHREGGRYWSAIGRFCTAYNKQYAAKLHPHTVSRWWKLGKHQLRADDLAGKQGQHLIGRTLIDSQPKVQEVVLANMLHRASHTLFQLQQKFANNPEITIPSYQSIARWRKKYQTENVNGYTLASMGKSKHRSKFRPALLRHNRDMDYANQKWEMDGTKVNVMTTDGKRYNITVLIDSFSRRVVTSISETVSGHSSAIAIAKAISIMGLPEIISTDNGKEFKNNQIQDAVAAVGSTLHFCNPGQPHEKPLVERVHGTMATQLFEMLDGAIGCNVAKRKELEDSGRGSKDASLTLESLERELAGWESYYNSHKHGTLGMSPLEKWATSDTEAHPIRKFNTSETDALLERMTRKTETRIVQNDGIRARNRYWADIAGEVSRYETKTVNISINLDQTQMRVWYNGELVAIAVPTDTWTEHEGFVAKRNADAKVNADAKGTVTQLKKAKKSSPPIAYSEIAAPGTVVAFEKVEIIAPEVLQPSVRALKLVEEIDQAEIDRLEERKKTLAAVSEPHAARLDRIIDLMDAGQDLNEDDRIYLEKQMNNGRFEEHMEMKNMGDLVIERFA
jgi:transposase InsO family protein